MLTNIHPTAIIDKKAQIGNNVTIGAFSLVEGDVVIGNNTEIGSHVHIFNGARIGNNCKIHKGAVVSSDPQDLKFGGEATLFEIGDDTTIREFCTLNRGTKEHMKSVVGSNCLLMAYVHVAHDCIIGDNVIMANAVQLGGHVEVEEYAIIGGMSPVHQFCHIGRHCMIGGHFRAVQDVPPYITASGEPLKYSGLNSIGLRRRGFKPETVLTLKRTYNLLYRSKLNVSQAVERIKSDIELIPEVQHVLDFIERSNRGLI
ncbi:acyl-ACP--UDP-N-acetylglucosamine O-acyltransferase [candidate division KSB1 bacterium]|nr:acyl-ACP--UDP-N-acetylglucosamine O-acyltransferase [candidate division KSB1 bacterium]